MLFTSSAELRYGNYEALYAPCPGSPAIGNDGTIHRTLVRPVTDVHMTPVIRVRLAI